MTGSRKRDTLCFRHRNSVCQSLAALYSVAPFVLCFTVARSQVAVYTYVGTVFVCARIIKADFIPLCGIFPTNSLVSTWQIVANVPGSDILSHCLTLCGCCLIYFPKRPAPCNPESKYLRQFILKGLCTVLSLSIQSLPCGSGLVSHSEWSGSG